jgi:pectin methylesterase-like acyl-CoA thioesterase
MKNTLKYLSALIFLHLIVISCFAQGYSILVAKDGSGDFTTIQAAFNAVPQNSTARTVIYVKSGQYTERVNLDKTRINVSLIGEALNSVTLSYSNYASKIDTSTGKPFGTTNSASTFIFADGFYAKNIIFENAAGPVGQALAINVNGDKAVFENCRFQGRQDTFYGGHCRQYFKNCYFEGSTDFIFGSSTAVFEGCEIHSFGGTAYTAASTQSYIPYGYVFINCHLTAEPGIKTDLGRPWGHYAAVSFIKCNLDACVNPAGWDDWNDTTNQSTARFSEYKNTGSGSGISQRVPWSNQLTDAQAALYTPLNILKTTNAATPVVDNWDPHAVINQTAAIPTGTLAFPTAEGYGRFTTGGRGGTVLFVTNLNDSGPGSLRAAIAATGKRTIVFKVSGNIVLASRLTISNGDVTIAGQTAPGDGICLSKYDFFVGADNVIVRYIRCRHGDLIGLDYDAAGGRNHKNVIIDHCSFSWGNDEVASFYDNTYFTMQWCIMSESLYHSTHPKGNHGFGAIWGGKGASYHHNLISSHSSRNPRFCGSRNHLSTAYEEIVDFRNNIVYNFGYNSSYGGESGNQNMFNNYYKPGPGTPTGTVRYRVINPSDTANTPLLSKWFVSGNYVDGNPAVTADNWNGGVQPDDKIVALSAFRVTSPFAYAPVATETPQNAYLSVLAKAGMNFPKLDSVDIRILSEAKSGTAKYGGLWGANTGIIDSQTQVGGWPVYNSTAPPKDTDQDGMPDAWETVRGLDPLVADNNGHMYNDGYTNLENYLNCMVGEGNCSDVCPSDPNKYAPGNCGCGKTETSCLDCAGVPYGKAYLDGCKKCVGGTTGAQPCVITGIAAAETKKTAIIAFPQPFDNTISIQLENGESVGSVTIVNTIGEIVYSQKGIKASTIEIGETLSAGLYSVILQTEKGIFTTKIFKIK